MILPGSNLPIIQFRQSFPLFEQLADACHGWELDFRQLGATEGPFWLEQIASAEVLYSRARFGSRFYQLGGTAPGFRTFSLLAMGSTPFRWCGESVTHNNLLAMPETGEFESVSLPGFDLFNLTVSQALLEEIANTQFKLSLAELLPQQRLFCSQGGEALVELRRMLHSLSSGLESDAVPPDVRLSREMEQSLAYLVLSILDSNDRKQPSGDRSKRMRTLAQALDLIDASQPGTLAINELAASTGVSRRTLEHAFRDGIGVSPASYLKSCRLGELSQRLIQADPALVSVAELAKSGGFSHLGQFAADYCAMFGELPSVTLRR